MRASIDGNHAHRCLRLLLRLRGMRRGAAPKDRGLLRVLLLRVGTVPSGSGQPIMLWHPPVTEEVAGTTRRADWEHGVRGCLTWGIPVTLLVLSPERYLVIVWPTLLTFMGVACLLNARRCGLGRYRSSSN